MQENQLKTFVNEALSNMKALNTVNLDISQISSFADTMVITTATSSRHCQSIANYLASAAKDQHLTCLGIEGQESGEWILVDFGDVVVHIMQPRVRDFYNLENLWSVDTLEEVSA